MVSAGPLSPDWDGRAGGAWCGGSFPGLGGSQRPAWSYPSRVVLRGPCKAEGRVAASEEVHYTGCVRAGHWEPCWDHGETLAPAVLVLSLWKAGLPNSESYIFQKCCTFNANI
ncbi:hypothetical protein NN561_018875 [Cricetulus griseus]